MADIGIVVSIAAAVFFIALALAVVRASPIVTLDLWVSEQVSRIQTQPLTVVMTAITNVLSPITAPIVTFVLLLWFLLQHHWQKIFLILLGLGGGLAIEMFFKVVIARPRPPLELVLATDYSFPSGHATLATIFFGLLVHLFADQMSSSRARIFFIVFNVIAILLVGLSRIYLEVHWLSDVVAGFLLGAGWLAAVIALSQSRFFVFESKT